MKPNFALSLSFDGIRLLHRVASGWHLVGEVALDAPDRDAELAMLRRTALALDPMGLRTKLLIPNEQIKYLSLDTGHATPQDVVAALEDATPYAVGDLVHDYTRGGGRTYIAAVARETLEEAEAFATEHRFAPVAFAATPEPHIFIGEVFFGPTRAAASLVPEGQSVERDEVPVSVIGHSHPRATDGLAAAPDQNADAGEEADAGPDADPDTTGDTGGVPDIAPDAPQMDHIAQPEQPPATPSPAPRHVRESILDDPDDTVQQPVPGEEHQTPSSGQGGPAASQGPRLAGATRDADAPGAPHAPLSATIPAPSAAPPITGQPENAIAQEQIVTTSLDAPDPEQALWRDRAGSEPGTGRSETMRGGDGQTRVRPDAAMAASMGATLAPLGTTDDAAFRQADRQGKAPGNPAGATSPPPAAALAATLTATRRPGDSAPSEHSGAHRTGASSIVNPSGRAQAAKAKNRGKPRFLALILTVVLLVFLAAVAAMAALAVEDGIAAWLKPAATTSQTATAPSGIPDATKGTAPVGETTGHDAPVSPVATRSSGEMILSKHSAGQESSQIGGMVALAALTRLPEPPSRNGAAPAGSGTVLSPAEAEAIYRSTGVWQRAARMPLIPRTETLDSLKTGLTDRADLHPAATFVSPPPQRPVELALVAPDAALVSPADPPPAGTVHARDAPQGMILAAATGPGVIPADDVASASATAGGVTLSILRPRLRADGAVEPDPATQMPPLARQPEEQEPEDIGQRPRMRPDNLSTRTADLTPQIETALAEIVAPVLENPTALAIEQSPRPDARPANIANIVAQTTQRGTSVAPAEVPAAGPAQAASLAAPMIAPAPATPAPAPAPAPALAPTPTPTPAPPQVVAPSGPITGGVAAAATMTRAMNLRDINLIGVYGSPNARRALVRLANGSYVKVRVGDGLDGGQITAIGDNALNYVKRGRLYMLAVPSG